LDPDLLATRHYHSFHTQLSPVIFGHKDKLLFSCLPKFDLCLGFFPYFEKYHWKNCRGGIVDCMGGICAGLPVLCSWIAVGGAVTIVTNNSVSPEAKMFTEVQT